MGILPYVLSIIGHGILLLIDIAALFVVIRLIGCQRSIGLFAAFDAAGHPLVNIVTRKVAALWGKFNPTSVLTEPQKLWLTLAALLTGRFFLTVLGSAIV